jgi:uncharacterized Zn finger protein
MRRWERDWPTPAPKKPPPEHGIKIKKAGTSWWGRRWIEALEHVLRGDSARLARGRTYARAGRTHDLVLAGGKVTARVTGSRPTPYEVTIELAQLSKAAWQQAIAGMAEKAQFGAELLAGQMPIEIDEVFSAAGTSLFPKERTELVTSCSCPDWGDPCKHVAATHYVLGEALDRDPFLLFELRGRTKARVLEELRAARGAGHAPAAPKKGRAKRAEAERLEVAASEVPRVAFGKVEPADYDRAREVLPALGFSFDAPIAEGAILRQLGVPAPWSAEASPADTLAPLVRRAAEVARRIAMAEPEPALDAEEAGRKDLERRPSKSRAKANPARVPVRRRVTQGRGR